MKWRYSAIHELMINSLTQLGEGVWTASRERERKQKTMRRNVVKWTRVSLECLWNKRERRTLGDDGRMGVEEDKEEEKEKEEEEEEKGGVRGRR